VLTKREQFHSNIIGQSITLTRDQVRARLEQMTDYFMAHGVADRTAAIAKAVGQLGVIVKRQALVMGFSDTFAVIGVILSIAAVTVLLARRPGAGASAAPAH
jgi:DHA2 family multidrug resistance protein